MEEHTSRPKLVPTPAHPPARGGTVITTDAVNLGPGKSTSGAPGHGQGSGGGQSAK